MITKRAIEEGYDKKIIKIIESPNGDGVVCSIGANWFYFGGLTAEECKTVDEYINVVPKDIIISDIYNVLQSFKYDGEEFYDEYLYYKYYLAERGVQACV